MKEVDAAWLAGYIDGDGCICLSRRSARSARTPEIIIDSCDKELLDRVKLLVGGTMTRKGMRTKSEQHRPAWHWRLNGARQVVALLQRIVPYLGCNDKRQRAELLIEKWASCTPIGGWYTDDLRAAKTAFEEQFLAIGFRRGIRTRKSPTTSSLVT